MSTPAGLPAEVLTDAKIVLALSEPGSALSHTGERLVVRVRGELAQEVPVWRVEQVLVQTRGASLTAAALRACALHGVPVVMLEPTGMPYAVVTSPNLVGTVATRRAQLRAYDTEVGGRLALAIVMGKLGNQAALLKYAGKYRKRGDMATYEVLADAAQRIEVLRAEVSSSSPDSPDNLRPSLLSREGRAGLLYWNAIGQVLPDELGFPGREHRGAQDPVNAALNYGYGVLESQVWAALLFVGLDPFGGYIHVDRPGRPALVLDLMEEFRAPVVDRAVLAMANTGQHLELAEGLLTRESRRLVAGRVLERLDTSERYGRKKYALRSIVRLQARAVVTHVRQERPYRAFTARW